MAAFLEGAAPVSASVLEYAYNDSSHVRAVTNINLNGNDHAFQYDANGTISLPLLST